MADIGTVIIGRSLNGGGRSSPFVNTGFDIVAYLPFFLVGVAVRRSRHKVSGIQGIIL
jgi:hypothetical protein